MVPTAGIQALCLARMENISMNRLIHQTKWSKIDALIPLEETRTEHLITLLASLTRLINL